MASQQQPDDLNNNTEDILESLLSLEETHFNEGYTYTLGYAEGIVSGKPDSRPLAREGAAIREMLKMALACCKVYISESQNKTALESIERAAKLFPAAAIVNKFEDEAYNRVGYTLISEMPVNLSSNSCPMNGAVLAMVKAAFEAIDLESHSGTHPRLGVVDHICFHPLASATIDQTASVAKSLATDVGSKLQVPTYLYGAAHEEGRTLAFIRRELGYFTPNSAKNQWAGGKILQPCHLNPDEGPTQAAETKGVVTIGATKWVDNYNVPLFSTDMSTARRIAKRVSERGGGLKGVQSMALVHGDGVIEVACNLLEPCKIGGDQVQFEVEKLAKEEGLSAGKGYYTDFSQDDIIERYRNLTSCSE